MSNNYTILIILILTTSQFKLVGQIQNLINEKVIIEFENCTSECSGSLGENIFTNGDFGFGVPNIYPIDPGVAPGYQYQISPPPADGWYCLTNNTNNWGSFAETYWLDIGDNGPEENGYMMVVNADFDPGLFYQKTVSVCESTTYEISVDVINLFRSSYPNAIKPNLSFLIDGVVVCETGDIPSDEIWHVSRFSFSTQVGQTELEFALRNNAPGGIGNDLAIDNISFRPCGPDVLLPDSISFCAETEVSIAPSFLNSPYLNPVFQWQILGVNGLWQDLVGQVDSVLTIENPTNGNLFRLLLSNQLVNITNNNCRVLSTPVVISEKDSLNVEVFIDSINCSGGTGTITAIPINGFAPYLYSWNTSDTSNFITGIQPGQYSVTVVDHEGCAGRVITDLPAPDSFSILLSTKAVTCNGDNNGQINLEIVTSALNESFAIQWSNGQSSGNIQQLAPGSYIVSVTNSVGCTIMGTAEIQEPQLIQANFSSVSTTCHNSDDGFAEVFVSGGTYPYNYFWENGSVNPNNNNLSPGWNKILVVDSNGCEKLDSVYTQTPSPIEVSFNTSNPSCIGNNNGAILVTTLNSVGQVAYSWSNGSATSHIMGLEAGKYIITITDSIGCVVVDSVLLINTDTLELDLLAQQISCYDFNDGILTANMSGGTSPYFYSWSNAETTESIMGLSEGLYTITITDSNNCSIIGEQYIYPPAPINYSLIPIIPSCYGGEDGVISVAVQGGNPPYYYNWNNGNSNEVIQGLASGWYFLSITDSKNCNVSDSIFLDQPPLLNLTILSDSVSCFGGQNGSAEVFGIGGTGSFSYLWSTNSTDKIINNLSAGDFSVTITDSNGCSNTVAFLIEQPEELFLQILSSNVSCSGVTDGAVETTVSGGIPPYNYLWSDGSIGNSLTGLSSGTYTLTVQDANQCELSGSTQIIEPDSILIIAELIKPHCFGLDDGVINLQVSGGIPPLTFLWDNGIDSSSLNMLLPGVYSVTVTDANGCTTEEKFELIGPGEIVLQLLTENTSCVDASDGIVQSMVSGGNPPYNYSWSNGSSDPFITQVKEGSYSLTVTDMNECQVEESVYLNSNFFPDLSLELFGKFTLGESILIKAENNFPNPSDLSFYWEGIGGDTTCNNCPDLFFTPSSSGCQILEIMDQNGCFARDTICFDIFPERNVFVPNVFQPDNDGVNDFFSVFGDKSVKLIRQLKVYDRWGEEVFRGQNLNVNEEILGWDGTFNGKKLNPGVFIWQSEIEFIDGVILFFKGDVTLVR